MAEIVLTDAALLVAQFDVTGDVNSVQLDYAAEVQDGTTFGDGTRKMVGNGALRTVDLSVEGLWNGGDDEVDDVLFDRIGTAGLLHTVAASGLTESNVGYFFQAVEGSYSPGASVGEILRFSVESQASGSDGLIRGNLLHTGTEAATGAAAAQNLGAATADQKVYAGLHVLSAAGTSPTLDVTIESDAADDFTGSETTRVTFAQVTDALGSEYATPVSGAITDTWWRVAYTIGGTGSPSFSFVVVLGIQ